MFLHPTFGLGLWYAHTAKIGNFFRQIFIAQRFPVHKKPKVFSLGYLEAKYGARASGNTLW